MRVSVNLQGGKELEKKLNNMEKKTAKKVIRKAARVSMKPVLAAAKNNAGSMIGGRMGAMIKKALAVRAFRKQKRGSFGVAVRLKPADEFIHVTKAGVRYYIPAAIEYGHDTVPARPFMRNAADHNFLKAEHIFRQETARGIETLARKS